MTDTPYDSAFFARQSDGSSKSAMIVVPFLLEQFHPASVVDVGCGVGTWAAVFAAHGVPRVVGIDGDYVARDQLRIPETSFSSADLNAVTADSATERFDMAICLEVAEHLEKESAENIVDFLCALSDRVVFGAAIPGQGGKNHVNEQWQSYWAKLFEQRGYVPTDAIRRFLWNTPDVQRHYLQNTLIYIRGADNAARAAEPLDIVHPRLLDGTLQRLKHARTEASDLRRQLGAAEKKHLAHVKNEAERVSKLRRQLAAAGNGQQADRKKTPDPSLSARLRRAARRLLSRRKTKS